MAVIEARILTIGWDSALGLFDDSTLREYLADREILRAEPQFFVHGGRPYWTVYLETRFLQGAGVRSADTEKKQEERTAALKAVLSELDEAQRARYDRILQWRREAARVEGVPHFVLCNNRQAVELARRAPKTLQALAALKGFGPKRVKKNGKQILEVLHGRIPESGPRQPDFVRAVDGDGKVDAESDGAVSETSPAEPDVSGGEHDTGNPGRSDDRGIPEGSHGEADGDQ